MLNRNPKLTLMLGLIALLIGNLLIFAKHWMHGDAWPDAIVGLFFGMAIGLLLLSVRQRVRRDYR